MKIERKDWEQLKDAAMKSLKQVIIDELIWQSILDMAEEQLGKEEMG